MQTQHNGDDHALIHPGPERELNLKRCSSHSHFSSSGFSWTKPTRQKKI